MTNATQKLFHFVYFMKAHDLGGSTRPFCTLVHKTRDGIAGTLLISRLYELGYPYHYVGPILNLPHLLHERFDKEKETRGESPVTDSLVLLTTRPPISDNPAEGERYILRSETDLETEIFNSLRMFISKCNRYEISLHDDDRFLCDPPDECARAFRVVNFFPRKGGRIQQIKAIEIAREANLAVGYLVSIPRVEPTGFRLLGAWSAGGSETLYWCQLLRTEYCNYLKKAVSSEVPRLWMVPFLAPDYVPQPTLWYDNKLIGQHQYPKVICWSLR